MPTSVRDKDSMKNILVVALSVCFVCAVIVSVAAVMLKPLRLANKELDRNKNILIAAGLYDESRNTEADIERLFERFTIKVVDFESGRFLSSSEIQAAGIDISKYDQRKAARDSSLSSALDSKQDLAQISRRARYAIVYLLGKNGDAGGDDMDRDGIDRNGIDKIVLPVHGYGLWSTLYGFLALAGDGNTVSGITFYEHAETAGLGGEVDNPKWKALWPGKKIYARDRRVALKVIKGRVDESAPGAEHKIDGLSGASLTGRGVENLIAFWMGKDGFGPLLANIDQRL